MARLINGLQGRANEAIVKTDGCYIGIVDGASPANLKGHWARALAAAQGDSGLAAFNEYWRRLASEGHLHAWTLLFDGVYKVALHVGTAPPLPMGEPDESVSGETDGVVWCPSGRVLVGSLAQLGDVPWTEIARVEPARYNVALRSSTDQQLLHHHLEGVDDYPADEGPDWTIYLSPAD